MADPLNPADVAGTTAVSGTSSPGITGKEYEPIASGEATLEDVRSELELAPELEQAGLRRVSETIELPPDVRQMGVSSHGPTQQMPTTTTVQLPISDDAIVQGLHASVFSSLRWLAEWCVKRLKKVHMHLKS